MTDPLIEVRSVSKAYRRDKIDVPVLNDLSISIPEGELFGLVGPSGSGKTTLLNLVAGIDRPDGGEIRVAGTDLGSLGESALADWRARHVGFIFQFYNLIPVLNAIENVELPLLLTHLSRGQRREHAERALSIVGLADRADHLPSQLSGGQQQRVAIARAIVTDPTLIVADEPTGDLDRDSAEQILDLLERLNRELGKTIVMVTHDTHAADRTTTRAELVKGELHEIHS